MIHIPPLSFFHEAIVFITDCFPFPSSPFHRTILEINLSRIQILFSEHPDVLTKEYQRIKCQFQQCSKGHAM